MLFRSQSKGTHLRSTSDSLFPPGRRLSPRLGSRLGFSFGSKGSFSVFRKKGEIREVFRGVSCLCKKNPKVSNPVLVLDRGICRWRFRVCLGFRGSLGCEEMGVRRWEVSAAKWASVTGVVRV